MDTRREWVKEGKREWWGHVWKSQNLISSIVSNAVESTNTDISACEAAKFAEGHQASSKHQDQEWDA